MAGKTLKQISCKDAGMACDFTVQDTDEAEVIAAAQDHARRKHGQNISAEQLRPMVKELKMA